MGGGGIRGFTDYSLIPPRIGVVRELRMWERDAVAVKSRREPELESLLRLAIIITSYCLFSGG